MLPGRRLLIASIVAVVGVIAICLAVFLPRNSGKSEEQPKPSVAQDASGVTVLSDFSQEIPESDSIFETGFTNPIVSTVSVNTGKTSQLPDGIAKGAQLGPEGSPDCTVPLNSSLESFIYLYPDCRIIFLIPNGPIGYNLQRQINITRPLTIIGNPIVRPIVRSLGAPVMFRVFPNASLDMRFISLGMGAGSVMPTYDGVMAVIQGGTFYVDFWGRIETTSCDISSPQVPAPLVDLADATGLIGEIRLNGGMVYVEGGVAVFTRTSFISIIAYSPANRMTLMGGLILNMFGDVVVNQCGVYIATRAVNPDVLGAFLTSLDGTITINGGKIDVAITFSRINGAGWSFYIGGGEFVSRGLVVGVVMLASIDCGTGFITVAGGVAITCGQPMALSVGFMASLSVGDVFMVGAGIAIRVGMSIAVAQMWAVFWGAGQLTFVGAGYSMIVGSALAACSIGRSNMGAGVLEFLGAGVYEIVGIALTLFDVMGDIFAAGALAFVGSGTVGIYGVAANVNVIMLVTFGKGAILFLGAGHLDVVGFVISPAFILTAVNPNIGLFYVGARIRRKLGGLPDAMGIAPLLLPEYNQTLLNNSPSLADLNDTKNTFLEHVATLDPLDMDSFGYGFNPFQGLERLGQYINIMGFVIKDVNEGKFSEAIVKAVSAITGIIDYRVILGTSSTPLLVFGDGCRSRKLEVKGTLSKYKNMLANAPAVAAPEKKAPITAMPVVSTPPEPRELATAEPACQVCNVTPISLVKSSNNSCSRCVVNAATCDAFNQAFEPKIPKKEDFTQVTLIKGRLTIACVLKNDTEDCVPKTLVETALHRMLKLPQSGTGLVVNTDIVMKKLFNKGEVTAPLSEDERNGTECTHKTTYKIYSTASFEDQASAVVSLMSNIGNGEPTVLQEFLSYLNGAETKICKVWMSQDVTSRTESLDPDRKADPNSQNPPGMGGSGRRLLEQGVPEAPKVEIITHECPDHTVVSELHPDDKVHLWFEGFDVGSDVVVQLMTHDGDREIPGRVLKIFPELVKAPAPVKWTGTLDLLDTPPGQYYLKVFHSDKPTYHYTYSDAFHIKPRGADGDDRP